MKFDINNLAKLANLTLTTAEKSKFETQLDDILKLVEKLDAVDTNKVEQTSQVTGLENVLREDSTKPSLRSEQALQQDVKKHEGYFIVKGVFNDE